jgi:hypothetical protein
VAPVHLIASSDEFLLEEQVREIARAASEDFGGVEPEFLAPEITPADLATELCSPSLFAPRRVFVLADLKLWVEPPPRGKAKRGSDQETVDVTPVVGVLEEGLSEDVALVIGALCQRKPKGPLISAVDAAGTFEWLATPEPPKPWEDVDLSEEQERVLRVVLERVAGDVDFTPGARKLLMHRLGYAPRLLVQEARKLVAAHVDRAVDENLVRALCFPKERSLEAVREAVLGKRVAPILDLLVAAEAGIAVRDWRGQLMAADKIPYVIASQVGSLCQQLLYLRRIAFRFGMGDELDPGRTGEGKWYPYQFKNRIGPSFLEHLKSDAPSPMIAPGKRPPSLFLLGQLFKGASQWLDDELVDALAGFGGVESGLRGKMPTEELSAWLVRTLGPRSSSGV